MDMFTLLKKTEKNWKIIIVGTSKWMKVIINYSYRRLQILEAKFSFSEFIAH